MKTNYKIGDEIKVTNPFHFAYGYIGNVLVNNTETNLKPINAILKDGLGSWQFHYADIELNVTMSLKTSDKPKPEIVKDVIEILEKVGFEQVKQKRQYRKKDKTEVKIVKEKRKYNKRVKP